VKGATKEARATLGEVLSSEHIFLLFELLWIPERLDFKKYISTTL
jgi:hypothetical protein